MGETFSCLVQWFFAFPCLHDVFAIWLWALPGICLFFCSDQQNGFWEGGVNGWVLGLFCFGGGFLGGLGEFQGIAGRFWIGFGNCQALRRGRFQIKLREGSGLIVFVSNIVFQWICILYFYMYLHVPCK